MTDGLSDHSVVFCVCQIKIPAFTPKYIKLRQCKNINVDCFIQDLIAIKWDRFHVIIFVDDAWNFYSEVTN